MNGLIITLCALIAVAASAPAETTPIPILRQSLDGPNPDGSYSYSYETGNGIQAQEQGHLKNIRSDEVALEAQGEYSYTAPNGELIKVTYIANEDGFQPQGDHIPAIPPLILKALEYIAAHPEENDLQ